MYIKIKKIEFQESKFGNDLKISMVGLYDDNGKYIKWIKLDEKTRKAIEDIKIPFEVISDHPAS